MLESGLNPPSELAPYDGLCIIKKEGGTADKCQRHLGGLTFDQLRLIYSGYNEAALGASGWDSTSDNDPSIHLWSELDPSGATEESRIAGDFINDGTHHPHFQATVMADVANAEDLDLESPVGYYQLGLFEKLVTHVRSFVNAIPYIC